jgi:glutathione S-transferase
MYRLHGFFTQNTLKTLYVLEELGVEYQYQFVDLMKLENRSEEFGQRTPVRKVPVLEHDGEHLFESGPICRYVASVEKSPLYPADKLQRARVDQWMTFFTCHPGRWLTTLFFEKIVKSAAKMGEPDEATCDRAVKMVHQQLVLVEDWMKDRQWLANDMFSIADPFALAYVEQASAIDFPLNDYPRVQSWFDRMEARQSTRRVRSLVEPFSKALMPE